MDIINFSDRIRVGSQQTLDIQPVEDHEAYGIYATFHIGLKDRVELRYKDGVYALFLFGDAEQKLPEWWQDSVAWSFTDEQPSP